MPYIAFLDVVLLVHSSLTLPLHLTCLNVFSLKCLNDSSGRSQGILCPLHNLNYFLLFSIVEKGFSWVARVLLGLCFCSGVIVWQIIQYPHWSIHVSLYVLCCVCVRGVAVPGHVSVCLCVCVYVCMCVWTTACVCVFNLYIPCYIIIHICILGQGVSCKQWDSGTYHHCLAPHNAFSTPTLRPMHVCQLWGTLSLRHPVFEAPCLRLWTS